MSTKGLPESLVARISPLDARAYAVSAGWKRVQGVNGVVAIYSHPSSDLDQLIIPLNAGASDYAHRMAEVIANMAEKENRAAPEILDDLLLPPSDVLRFRLAEPESASGDVPLEQGINLLLGAKKALLSAACSVIQPQEFHPRLSRSEAEDLVQASRMGQTERGSFTVTIACPLAAPRAAGAAPATPLLPFFAASEPDPADEMKSPSVPSFTREVTTLLMQSVARITSAVDADNLASLKGRGAGGPLLSANLCDALLMMAPSGDRSRLTVIASWSRAIPRPDSAERFSRVDLRHEYFRAIETLSTILRPTKEPKRTGLIGLVDALLGEPDETGRVQGEAQLLILNQEEGTIRARVVLGAADYHQAWEAHGVGGYVSLSGLLIPGVRTYRIESIQDFTALKLSSSSGASRMGSVDSPPSES